MKQVTNTYYSFNELSETAQNKAIENLYDINVDYNWWDFTYDDAKEIGIEIQGFDIERGAYCKLNKFSCNDVMYGIFANHGEESKTYKAAIQFKDNWDNLVYKHSDGIKTDIVSYDNIDAFDTLAEELEDDFREQIANCYLSILRNEYEYLTSREAIIETILANEYFFTEDGYLEP